MDKARRVLDWDAQFDAAIDPEKARRYRQEAKPEKEDTCSMCGNFCAVKNMNKIMDGEIVQYNRRFFLQHSSYPDYGYHNQDIPI